MKNASQFGGDRHRVIIAGVSAGGMVGLALARKIVHNQALSSPLCGIAAIIPQTVHFDNVPEKYKAMYNSYSEYDTASPVIDGRLMRTFFDAAKLDPADETAFTLLAVQDHAKFPPTYLVSCQCDPTRDDTTVLLQALQDAGVETKHDFYEGLPHNFWISPSLPENERFVMNLGAGIKWLLGRR
jgi:versiconal hemiacetal acetate esterase